MAPRWLTPWLVGFALVALRPAPAAAEPGPRQTVEAADRRIRELLAAPAGARRDADLRAVAGELLDVEQMARDALRDSWDRASEAERQEVLALLRPLIERSYLEPARAGVSYRLQIGRLSVDRDHAWLETVVRSTDASGRERALQVELALALRDGRWRVIEIATDGVRLVRGYRIQFTRLIRGVGFQALLRRMRERLAGVDAAAGP